MFSAELRMLDTDVYFSLLAHGELLLDPDGRSIYTHFDFQIELCRHELPHHLLRHNGMG